MGNGLSWGGVHPHMGGICGIMCSGNTEKHNICMFSNFGKEARSADVSRSIRKVCISLKKPIWAYMGFSVGVKTGFLIPRGQGQTPRNNNYI